jgi:hypothetical protein
MKDKPYKQDEFNAAAKRGDIDAMVNAFAADASPSWHEWQPLQDAIAGGRWEAAGWIICAAGYLDETGRVAINDAMRCVVRNMGAGRKVVL